MVNADGVSQAARPGSARSDASGHRELGYDEVFEPDPCPWLADGLSSTLMNYDPSLIDEDQVAVLPTAPLGSDRTIGDPATDAVTRPVDELDALVDDLQIAEAELSRVHARRAVLLAHANAWAESMVDSVVPVGGTPSYRREMSHRAVVAEISCALRIPRQTVGAELDSAVTLVGMPATMQSLRDGTISFRHAEVVADTCLSVPAEGRGALEAELLPVAETSTVARLRRKARDARERVHPVSIEERTRAAVAGRRVGFEPADDGMGWIHHYLPIASALGIYETASQVASSKRGPSEARTMDQLRSDVLTELIDEGLNALVSGSSDGQEHSRSSKRSKKIRRRVRALRPSVFLTMPVFSAMGLSDEPAVLEGYGPIDPATARALVADAPGFYRVLTHPVTGTILDVDRKQYRPPADLRRWLRLRDQTCRGPFCGKRAIHSDLDHSLAWAHGGGTRATNLAHMREGDHVMKHGTSWQVAQDEGGVLQWTSPTGRRYTTVPETPVGRQAVREVLAQLAAQAEQTATVTDMTTDDHSPPF